MPPESALLESRVLRDSMGDRTDVLDKVKVLTMLPDGLHVTTRMVAGYFEVAEQAIKSLVKRHREELRSNGMHTLHGSELQFFERSNMDLSAESYPQGRAHLTLYTCRTMLNVAMLLRDSEVARRVRTYLLDVEEASRSHAPAQFTAGDRSFDARLSNVESCLGDVGASLRELGPVIAGISVRLERVDRRLDATNRVVCAMSERLCDLSEDMREVRQDVAVLKSQSAKALRRRGGGS
ncbi:hypothetical protein AB0C51_05670 [Streptomyces pathocidini]|uniref:Uncharacterized protein n=1 Tax=Streptomyces pathocidini TaxID=1650571 RepID=A0ABW7US34_9ACTN|nr:hypothetical protein [Streptomyces pathocidini]